MTQIVNRPNHTAHDSFDDDHTVVDEKEIRFFHAASPHIIVISICPISDTAPR